MNLPDAPIAHEGFFATHFFTVSDREIHQIRGPRRCDLRRRFQTVFFCAVRIGQPGRSILGATRPRVVIVGGGFGGLFATRELAGAPVSVTLIDKRNYHLFRPMLCGIPTPVRLAVIVGQPSEAGPYTIRGTSTPAALS
jgi:putative NAD(P)-binding protein